MRKRWVVGGEKKGKAMCKGERAREKRERGDRARVKEGEKRALSDKQRDITGRTTAQPRRERKREAPPCMFSFSFFLPLPLSVFSLLAAASGCNSAGNAAQRHCQGRTHKTSATGWFRPFHGRLAFSPLRSNAHISECHASEAHEQKKRCCAHGCRCLYPGQPERGRGKKKAREGKRRKR